MLYPNEAQYIPLVRKWSRKRNLPEHIVLGIVAVESAFNPNAYRSEPHIGDASFGLMQILERTAQGVGFKKPTFSVGKHPLFDPETNVMYGTAFLEQLVKRYQKIEDAIAAYNAGFPRPATATTPHIIRIYGAPKSDWKYANQPYVDAVLRNARYFKALIEGKSEEAKKYEEAVRASWKKRTVGSVLGAVAIALAIASLFVKR